MALERWLNELVTRGGSDLIVSPNLPPTIRGCGTLEALQEENISPQTLASLVSNLLTDEQKAALDRHGDVRLRHVSEGESFRAHICRTATGMTAVIHHRPRGLEPRALGIPEVVSKLTAHGHGLTLIVGPGSSGKSTTALCLVEAAAARASMQVVVIETPLEVRPQASSSLITYKSVGLHAPSLRAALDAARDEGADLLYVSDVRPGEDFAALLNVATSGPQVIATMSAPDAASCLELVTSAVPPQEASGMLNALSEVLVVLATQHLLPRRDGTGMVPAFEVLVGTPPTKAAVREGRTGMLGALIQTGQGDGMQSLDAVLGKLIADDVVELHHALAAASDPEALQGRFGEALP